MKIQFRDRVLQFLMRLARPFTKATPTPVDDAVVKAIPNARRGLRIFANGAARREKARKAGLLILLIALVAGSGCVTLDRAGIWLDRECPETEDLPPAEWEDTGTP